ncbi:SubName: Full=Uncharacterized protein {ECO:0000313/EMBL:CCA70142.1} [Serendipita indica DSM 11827]|nr:SubName: Full=Uncharacterized protein {ECO:0000313/EMBL:CCA70142.1} [Serendipita indica DSM 11827]
MFRYAARTGQIRVVHQQIARYAAPGLTFWRKGLNPFSPERKFAPLKTHLHAEYTNILQKNSLLLFISTKDLKIGVIQKLRADLEGTTRPKSATNPFGIPKTSNATRRPPTLLSIKPDMFMAAMRKDSHVNGTRRGLAPLLKGPISVLSLPVLDPEHLGAVLKVLDRALPKSSAEQTTRPKEDPLAMPPPGGGGVQKAKQPPVPGLKVLGGVVEGRLFLLPGLQEVTKLPTLQVLHSQIVGLLSSPASQLVGVLGQAGGGRIARTLQGLVKGLEEQSAEMPTS